MPRDQDSPKDPRSVVDDLQALIREVIDFAQTIGARVEQLDTHKDTLHHLRELLDRIEVQKAKENDLKAREEKRLARDGGRDHEFRMRVLSASGGLLTGSIVPALLWYFLGYTVPVPAPVPAPAHVEAPDAQPLP